MSRPSKPSIAIIGSGLAGSLLASRLGGAFDITVFERGSLKTSVPNDITFFGQPRGLAPPLRYGLGGTTSLWAGGLMEFLDSELQAHWPRDVVQSIVKWRDDVLPILGGQKVFDQWHKTQMQLLDGRSSVIGMYMPEAPFRGLSSLAIQDYELKTGCQTLYLEESDAGVRVVYEQASQRLVERFDHVVVSAGAMQSPHLLMASGLGGDAIGKNLTDHPMGFIAKLHHPDSTPLLETLINNGRKNRVRHCVKVKDEQTGLTTAFYLRAAIGEQIIDDPYYTTCQVVKQKGRFKRHISAIRHFKSKDFLAQAIEHQLSYRVPSNYSYILAVSEQEATGQGCVTPIQTGRSQCNWDVSDVVEAAILRNGRKFSELLSGTLILPDEPLKSRLFSSAHLSGTCRLTLHGNSGVDTTLSVRGTKRISVCDGSVLPSTGATNTGLTIGCLSFALAEHLKSQYA